MQGQICTHRLETGKSGHRDWPRQLGARGSLEGTVAPKAAAGQQSREPAGGQSQWSGGLRSPREGRHSTAGGCEPPGSPSLRPCPWPARALRGQAQRAQGVPRCRVSDYPSLFTLTAHLLLLSPATRPVVMKSLYLHKVIVHVIKKKKLY